MADAVTTQTVFSGNRSLVMRFTNISDGTGESNVKKVDVSDYTLKDGTIVTSVVIEKIEYNCFGMAVKISSDHDTDVTRAVLQGFGCMNFSKAGGLQTAGAQGPNDLLFTTVGHTSGDTYDITLWCRLKA